MVLGLRKPVVLSVRTLVVLSVRTLGVGAFVIFSLAMLPVAHAQSRKTAVKGLYKFRVENPDCSLRIRTDSGWQVYHGPHLTKGSVVVGRPSNKSPDLIAFKSRDVPGSILAGRRSCLFKSDTAEELNVGSKYKIQVGMAFVSWQESLKLHASADSTTTHLRATNVVLCPGVSMLRIRGTYEYGANLCAFYGKSQAGRAAPTVTETNDTKEYLAKNVNLYGMAFTPKLLWRPESGNVAFGFSTPIMFRYGVWPVDVAVSDSVGPKFWFLIGLALETRFDLGSFYFGQRVGFLNLPKSLAWALEGGYSF